MVREQHDERHVIVIGHMTAGGAIGVVPAAVPGSGPSNPAPVRMEPPYGRSRTARIPAAIDEIWP